MGQKNAFYESWIENLQKKNEQELLDIIHNPGSYESEYKALTIARLVDDFNYNKKEIEEELAREETKDFKAKVLAETDIPLSLSGKAWIVFGFLFLHIITFFIVLNMMTKKVHNSIGERRYLYNKEGRNWMRNVLLLYLVLFGFLFLSYLSR